jgi:hypothetical protein
MRAREKSSMAEYIEQAPQLSSNFDQPLIGIPFFENGREEVRYFTDEAAADAAVSKHTIQLAISLAGSWSDLDWDKMEMAFDRIRHESQPTPPIVL